MTATRTRLRQLLPAAVLAAALGIGDGSAIANAEPGGTWDIELYDECMTHVPQNAWGCCTLSGGEWNGRECHAPAPLVQGGDTSPTPIPPIGPVRPPSTRG